MPAGKPAPRAPEAGGGARARFAGAPMAVSCLLGLAIAAEAANIAWSLSRDSSIASGQHVAARAAHRTRRVAALIAAHLFGVAPQEELRAGNAGPTPLVLTGIIATNDPHAGFAIVGSSPANTHTVYTGTEAAPGTILAEVYPHEVVLQRGSERLTLRLPHKDLAGERATSSLERPIRVARDDAGGGSDSEDADYTAPHTLADRLTDSAAVVNAFALLQTSVDGVSGAQIMSTGINSKALRALGLAPGDLIVQVNGAKVGAVDAPTLMKAFEEGAVTLVVDRAGDALSVAIDQDSLADAAALYRKADPNL